MNPEPPSDRRLFVRYNNYMSSPLVRAGVGAVLALAAGGAGYALHSPSAGSATSGNTRVIYSLDAKQNDQEIIALINASHDHIYFAMYEFTLGDIADALVAAKKRGVDVEGLVDAGESADSYDAPIIAKLTAAGIPVETEKHPDGSGIMHIKAIVIDSSYAIGSYNWTESATKENDELLEIGTDPGLVATYTSILKRLIAQYAGNAAPAAGAAASSEQGTPTGTFDYTEAPSHIGEYASISGTLIDAYTASSGTVFLDFCKNYKSCPFSAVVFAGDAPSFGDLSRYAGKTITLTGTIASYQGVAEMVLTDPSQLAD